MSRQAVSKHLLILEKANLVVTRKEGRHKLHYLNPVPVYEIYTRWIGRFEQGRLAALDNLKQALTKGRQLSAVGTSLNKQLYRQEIEHGT